METTQCLLSDKWIKRMRYIYTMEYYSALQKDEILSFVIKLMNLENIILREISQYRKNDTA